MSAGVLEDPFADVQDFRAPARQQIITAGRYRLPNRDGSPKKGGWQRVTNLCAAISDQFGLRVWEIEQVITAFASRPALADEARSMLERIQGIPKMERRSEIEKFLEICKAISGGDAGSKFGNHRHSIVEADHLKLPMAVPDSYARQHLHLYRSALIRNKLQAEEGMQERRVLVEELEAIGTLDNILIDKEKWTRHIADLKTQKKFWTYLEVAAQLACYAHAVAMWEPSSPDDAMSGRWVDMPKVSLETAMILWMPREPSDLKMASVWTPHVDVIEVDIKAGWETAKLCRRVIEDRAGGKRARDPRAWLRSAPEISKTESYAARLAAVETREEGSRLVAEIQGLGLWSPVLADEAKIALDRIAKKA